MGSDLSSAQLASLEILQYLPSGGVSQSLEDTSVVLHIHILANVLIRSRGPVPDRIGVGAQPPERRWRLRGWTSGNYESLRGCLVLQFGCPEGPGGDLETRVLEIAGDLLHAMSVGGERELRTECIVPV